jgi:hypothetical protein
MKKLTEPNVINIMMDMLERMPGLIVRLSHHDRCIAIGMNEVIEELFNVSIRNTTVSLFRPRPYNQVILAEVDVRDPDMEGKLKAAMSDELKYKATELSKKARAFRNVANGLSEIETSD